MYWFNYMYASYISRYVGTRYNPIPARRELISLWDLLMPSTYVRTQGRLPSAGGGVGNTL